MTKRRGLGRGLSSLIPVDESFDASTGMITVRIDEIEPNPHQPRGNIDKSSLNELAVSIKEHGLIQPIIVTSNDKGKYIIIAGERRWRAADLAGFDELQVIIKEATPQSMLEMALVENIQRDDLNAIEEAHAYRQLIDEFGLTQEDVSRRVGKSRSTVANIVRLISLPINIQSAVLDGDISGAHARALLPLPTPESQSSLMNTIIKRDLNVRQVEDIVKKMLAGEKPKPTLPKQRSPEVVELESQFQRSLGTKVTIQEGKKGGKIIIHFYSGEDLEAIYESIVGDSG